MASKSKTAVPTIPDLFTYPINGVRVMCQRLKMISKGALVRIVEDDNPDGQSYFISSKYFDAIRPMEEVNLDGKPACSSTPSPVNNVSPSTPQA